MCQIIVLFMLFIVSSPYGETLLSKNLTEEIVSLVKRNPYQMNIRQYSYIAELILENPNCNMLVFGVGKDSYLYQRLNPKGKIVFLEDSKGWIEFVKQENPNLEIYQVCYDTLRTQWKEFLEGDPNRLYLEIPNFLREIDWDIVLVDGPAGHNPRSPGRMKSIFTAAQLTYNSKVGTHVLVHDSDREVEYHYCHHFLGKENLVNQVNSLKHFYITEK